MTTDHESDGANGRRLLNRKNRCVADHLEKPTEATRAALDNAQRDLCAWLDAEPPAPPTADPRVDEMLKRFDEVRDVRVSFDASAEDAKVIGTVSLAAGVFAREVRRLRAELASIRQPLPVPADGLKPCPFCGSATASVREDDGDHHGPLRWAVYCHGEECAADAGWHATEAEAIAAWNRRAPTDADTGRRLVREFFAAKEAVIDATNEQGPREVAEADARFDKCETALADWAATPSDESDLDRISCALGLGAPAVPVDDMVTEIGRIRDGDRAQLRTLKDLTLLRCLVLEYFRVKKYAAEAWAPGGTTADRETWANAEMEACEAMRKAVMG